MRLVDGNDDHVETTLYKENNMTVSVANYASNLRLILKCFLLEQPIV